MDIKFQDAYRKFGTSVFNVMAKPVGPLCNLNCTYCYYLEKSKLYQEKSKMRMSDEVLEAFVKQYIQSQKLEQVEFIWQGGEPALAGLDFYKKVVDFQTKYRGKKTITNAFQTNGTLLDDEWCRFLRKHDFLVGISIDGPEELHDQYRTKSSGQGTFREVINAIRLLRKHRVRFNTMTVVNDLNSKYPIEVYNFLKSIRSQFMQFLPIVEQAAYAETCLNLISPFQEVDSEVTSWSVDPKAYGSFLTTIFDEWVKKDVGKYFVQIFDTTLASWSRTAPALCVFQRTCGEASVIEFNGDIYSCDHFVYPENLLGNIMETDLNTLMKKKQQVDFGLEKETLLPRQCTQCRYRNICHGGCPKNRTSETFEKGKRLNYLCEGYKHFFSHVEPYMEFMTNELRNKRSPENVMRNRHKIKVKQG